MSDTFDKLIADMRKETSASGDSLLGEYVDRLVALVNEIEPMTLPSFGSVGVEPGDDPPIFREVAQLRVTEDPDAT